MAENKTQPTDRNVTEFLEGVTDPQRRADCFTLVAMMKKATKAEPRMWGDSIVGFGEFHYKSERSRCEGDWFYIGFSPRKQNLTLYFCQYLENFGSILDRLGKHKTGKGCLYVRKLEDIDVKVLAELMKSVLSEMKKKK